MAVDPTPGGLDEFDPLPEDARGPGLKAILDIVPHHCYAQGARFPHALRAAPGSAARTCFHFADGRGEYGDLPPDTPRAMSGGAAWLRVQGADGWPGQWRPHPFTPHQPDFNWRDADAAEHLDDVPRYRLDRGAEGFRADFRVGVAIGLHKPPGLPDAPASTQPVLTGQALRRQAGRRASPGRPPARATGRWTGTAASAVDQNVRCPSDPGI